MRLDEFQKQVLQIIMPSPSPDSVFAGASVPQPRGFRLSDDQDIFHSEESDLSAIAERDVRSLEAAGFAVEPRHPYNGLVEATVSSEAEGFTRLLWVQSGSWKFFKPFPTLIWMATAAIDRAMIARAIEGRKRL